jgi:signal transduction histidine kinase/ActR/RegA family two-component response regulator
MVASTSAAHSPMLPSYAAHVLRALPDAAAFVSADGNLLAANRSARAALRLRSAREMPCDLFALVASPREKLADTLRTWSRSTEPTPGAFTMRIEDDLATFEGKGSVVFPSTDGPAILLVRFWRRGRANPFVLLNQKITELNDEVARRVQVEEALRRSEAALQARVSEAEALNRAKDEFLATVSHELRTPLNAIVGWAALLSRRVLDEDIGKAVEVIHRNAEAQAKLIDDILDVSRIITGKMLLEPRPADLAVLVAEAVEVVRPSAAAKQIDIVFSRPEGACLLIADPDRIRQVAWNVLSNAVKFTDRGGAVRVEVLRRGSQLALTVTDTGRGIESEFLPFVFDRFRQADSSTTRRTGGLGLGLALVRHIVELHGGVVEARSGGAGRGATFSIALPIRAVGVAADPGPSHVASSDGDGARPREAGALDGLKVLVVDDEPDARDLLAAVLTQAGGEVQTAGSAAVAFDTVVRFRPHVLVSDIGMPDENGYSLIRRLRALQQDACGTIPSLALTAYARAEDRAHALAAGFTAHLGKPVSPDELVSAVVHLTTHPCR